MGLERALPATQLLPGEPAVRTGAISIEEAAADTHEQLYYGCFFDLAAVYAGPMGSAFRQGGVLLA